MANHFIMEKINWAKIQAMSNPFLADGIWELVNRPFENYRKVTCTDFGNYLISHEKKPFYIGEAKDLCNRLRQQFRQTTSTFFKNYIKYCSATEAPNMVSIGDFEVQHMVTLFGRKEIEEFGIVNVPTLLNRFQLNKRTNQKIDRQDGYWNALQSRSHALLKEGEKEIFKTPFRNWFDNLVLNHPGLYIVQNGKNELIYIGESSNINERFTTHSGQTYFSALRRHIATEILHFELKEIKGRKKYLEEKEDAAVSNYLKSCKALFYPTYIGRYELEEYLIKNYKPLLNRKDNRE